MSREWTQSLYSIALDASVRAVLLAGVVGLILGALRIRSSGVRYAAWRAVLCAMLLMPALPYFIAAIAMPLRISPTAPRLADAPAQRSSAAHVIQTPEAASSGLGQSKGMSSAFVAAPAHTSIWALGLIAYASGVLVLLFRLLLGWRFMKRIVDSSVRAGYAFLPD